MTRRQARPAMAGLAMLQQEVNELFQRLSILDRSDRLPGSEWSPAVDVLELRERLIVIVEVPGLALDSLKVAFRDRALVLIGDRRAPRVGQGARFHCLERPHGKFERTIPMDEPVDVAHASADARRWAPDRDPAAAARAARPRDRHPDREGAHGMSDELKDDQAPPPPQDQPKVPDVLPVLPLRDIVIFPFMIVPLYVSRDRSIRAVDQALAENRMILLAAQKKQDEDDPGADDIYPVGTAALIMRMLKLPDGRIRVLVQGLSRARIASYDEGLPHLQAHVETVPEPETSRDTLEVEAMMRNVKAALEKSQNLGKPISPEVIVIANNMEEPGRLADLTASNLDLKVEGAQAILEALDPVERLRRVHELMTKELEVLTMQQEISSQAKGEMDRSQREFFLRQQLKAIQSELGEGNELGEEIAQLRDKAGKAKMPKPVMEEVERQLKKLERMHPDAAETATLRNWLDWMVTLPWGKVTKDSLDLVQAQKILDEDHYGLEKVKERIIEYLAVRKLKDKTKGPLLCFVGPPGVGKTSLGRSIARALGRKFVRLSLGGVKDEAEIRGHRRTYVGSMPGRIIQGIHQAGANNPVFMMDEVDKIGADFRGDPSSALLEVLDPEQNNAFRDHYLGVPFDLSNVMFICTANLTDTIQPAFLDRMEVIRLSGYTEDEKLEIAKRHLVPKQLEEHGLTPENLVFTDPALKAVVNTYTREAGLRNFEREIAQVAARWRARWPRATPGRYARRPARSASSWARPRRCPRSGSRRTRSASRRASPGPPPAATCSSSRPRS